MEKKRLTAASPKSFMEPIRFESVPFLENWQSIADYWGKLFQACERPCVFYHPLFLAAAHQSPAHMRPDILILGWKGDHLVFGFPARINKHPMSIHELEFYSILGFDHISPLDASEGGLACDAFLRETMGTFPFHSLRITNASETFADVLSGYFGNHLFTRNAFRCPFLDLPSDPVEILPRLSRNFRSNLNRRCHQIDRLGIRFRFISEKSRESSLVDAFQELVKNHHDRTEAKNGISKFLEHDSLSFYRAMCRVASQFDPNILIMEAHLDGSVIGSFMGFCSHTTFYFHQHGFLKEYGKYSLGNVMFFRMMEHLISKKFLTFDFLRGADTYKFNWTNTWYTDKLVLFPLSPRGRITVFKRRLTRSARARGKVRGIVAVLRNKDD